MCGIVGFIGKHQAAPILLDSLSKLEYRGYDSAGLAVRNGDADIEVVKAKGRLKVLAEKTNDGKAMQGTCGIGHTRWATHGEPSETNAHPHHSDDGNVVAVHNGIIENYQELRDKLAKKGYEFYSQTDTEVAVKLIDYYYKKYEGTPVDAINHAMIRIRGSYALAVMFKEYPEEIYVARKDSPMILATANGESYVASDVPAILSYARNVYYIGNLEIGRLRAGEITFYNLDGDEIEKEPKEINWDAQAAEKAGFEHFMMKEIHEQPKAIKDTLGSVVKDGKIDLSNVGLAKEDIENISQINIVGIKTLGIVNVVGSSIAREADNVFYTLAGPEISVATTKAYSTQLIASYILAIEFAMVRGQINQEQYDGFLSELSELPDKIQKIIDDKERLQWFASKQANAKDIFFVGRGIDYAISLEGSLKLKEISYIHSEAYAAGELKHGTISLIEDGTLVIGVLTQNDLYEKTISNMVECKSRGAYLMGLTTYGNYNIEDTVEFATYIPKTDGHFAASLAVIPLQLLAYYVSVAKGLDVDKPRNLAKSVTVE